MRVRYRNTLLKALTTAGTPLSPRIARPPERPAPDRDARTAAQVADDHSHEVPPPPRADPNHRSTDWYFAQKLASLGMDQGGVKAYVDDGDGEPAEAFNPFSTFDVCTYT